jgi:uncharacterized membrane protein
MKPDRLNAFTDGVLAVIITIMVLELKFPAQPDLAAALAVMPLLGAYLLSFINIGIFWSNHHHMLQSASKVNGAVLWANLCLLFCLSLIPLVIRWIDEAGMTPWPVAAYGFILVLSAIAYLLLEQALIAAEGEGSSVRKALGRHVKEWVSLSLYALGMVVAFLVSPMVSVALYVVVAITWLIPDRRFERQRDLQL